MAHDWNDLKMDLENDIQDRYENAVVSYMLRKLGRTDDAPALLRCVRVGKPDMLSLEAFCEYFNYPVWLKSRKIPYLETLEKDLRTKHKRTPIFRYYDELMLERPVDSTLAGLVFQWPERGKFYVFYARETWPANSSTGQFWVVGASPVRYWIQPLDDLMVEYPLGG